MRRSVCFCEPKSALAGEIATRNFVYTPANLLPKGARLKFDFLSKGREIDWQIPQTNLKTKSNLIWMELPNNKELGAKEVTAPKQKVPQFEFILPIDVKPGEQITICLGSPDPKQSDKKGNQGQTFIQRRRTFNLYIDPKGKGNYKETESFQLDIRGNVLASIRCVVTSIVNKNQRFDVIVRFEDAYGNLSGNAPEGTLIEFSYEQLRENINWKLFVPETGFIALPNLYFNEIGIYKIQLKNLMTNDTFYSSPIKCFADHANQLYWGLFHGESVLYDAGKNIESCLRYNRDDKALQFYSTSSFESEDETPSDLWKMITSQISEFNEEDRFTTYLGMQWCGAAESEGLRQIIYLKDNKPILRKNESKSNNLKKIYKSHQPKDLISIPSFTMANQCVYNFENFTPEYEHVVEIYNAWGSSECLSSEGNTKPIYSKSKKGFNEKKEGSIRAALNNNYRFGFVAGGLDDRGIFSKLYDTDQVQYTPGLTAVLSPNHSRDSIIQALMNHSCYATTGARMIIGLNIAEKPMGTKLDIQNKPGLSFNRHITGYAIGTTQIKEITIFRNGKEYKTFKPEADFFEFTMDDSDLLEKLLLKANNGNPECVYYYMRVIQEDEHIAWTSPIWVDVTPSENVIAVISKKTKPKMKSR